MARFSNFPLAVSVLLMSILSCCGSHPRGDESSGSLSPSESVVISSSFGTPRPPFSFSISDEQMLDEVQKGAFLFFWRECSPTTGMVVDRSSVTFASAAGVGFQLAALPVGVERGWVTHRQAEERALLILRSLDANDQNRKAGLFYHFLTGADASPVPQDVVSTIDSALLFAGILTAGSYFGGEVRQRGDALFEAADWAFFVEHSPRPHEQHMKGFLSLGWQPRSFDDPTGDGALKPYYWADCGDEHRLVTLLAIAAPRPERRVDPMLYYRMRRPMGRYGEIGPMVYLPWSGALFTSFFAHCFIDYAHMGPDDPKSCGVDRRPRVDWWENSRRTVALHRAKAMEASHRFPNLGPNSWGLTACDGPNGYMVPGVYPDPIDSPDLIPDIDYAKWAPRDDFGDGTIAPYGAGCSILFDRDAALDALRHYRSLMDSSGRPSVWRDPDAEAVHGAGFRDSFNAPIGWVAPDFVAIDQGPLLLAIENARTGKVWTWFHGHPIVKTALSRAQLTCPQ